MSTTPFTGDNPSFIRSGSSLAGIMIVFLNHSITFDEILK
jgi:hypothetical protein